MAWFEYWGNREADRCAKLGARLHPQLNMEVLERRWETSKAAAALLLRHHGEVLKRHARLGWPDR
eukprot:3318329-Pyramimonas_sp.AAC.1